MSDAGSDAAPKKKRRRTAQACGPCRLKKSKCDGAQPTCTPCRDLGRSCSYPLESAPLPADKMVVDVSYLGDLEAMARLYRMSSTRQWDDASVPSQQASHHTGVPNGRSDIPLNGPQPASSDMGDHSANQWFDTTATTSQRNVNEHQALAPFSDSGGSGMLPSPQGGEGSAVSGISIELENHPSVPPMLAPAYTQFDAYTHSDPPSAGQSSRQLTSSLSTNGTPEDIADREMDGMGLLPTVVPDSARRPASQDNLNTAALSQLAGIASDFEYYGDTSGVQFHSVLLDTLLPGYQCLIGCEDPSGQNRGSDYPRAGFLGLPFETDPQYKRLHIDEKDLPTMETAQRVWGIFGMEVHCLYPFISLDILRHSYSAMLKGFHKGATQPGDTSWRADRPLDNPLYQPLLALHFSIFALVKAMAPQQFNETLVNAHTIALQLLRRQQDWPHSTLKVQALLHGILLLQSVDCPGHSWNILGYAVRTAYAVGLHQSANLLSLSPLDREIRCRAWWGCFIFDRLLTVTIGRPSAITVTDPNFPKVKPLWGEQPSSLLFFQESIRLHQALTDLTANPPLMTAPLHLDVQALESATNATANLEMEYAKWADNVGAELQVDERQGRFVQPLALALALRGSTMRLLLHRPVLLAYIREQVNHSTAVAKAAAIASTVGPRHHALTEKRRQQAVGESLAAIIETAVYTVKLLKMGGGGPGALSAPWYQLFYAMNAFMSLVATFLIDLSQWSAYLSTPSTEILDALHSVHRLIDQMYRNHNRSAARRALGLVQQVMQVLGLLKDPAPPDRDTARLSANKEDLFLDVPSKHVPFSDLGLGPEASSAELPQLGYEELYKLLDLSTGQRSSDMPTADWLGMFGSSG